MWLSVPLGLFFGKTLSMLASFPHLFTDYTASSRLAEAWPGPSVSPRGVAGTQQWLGSTHTSSGNILLPPICTRL